MMDIATLLMFAGAWLIVAITLERVLRHRHKWYARAVDHGVMSEPRRNATAILYVCASCGEAKSATVAGTYELEDVGWPLSDRVETKQHEIENIPWSAADQAFARSMKVKL
ncbi:MAG TPA: hypothetical protein VK473_13580 [Terriglobales bacterium]|nr:hypothetical protein [Terriglobales bacterium]